MVNRGTFFDEGRAMSDAKTSAVRHILVISHTARQEAIDTTDAVCKKLSGAGVSIVMSAEDRAEFTPHLPGVSILTLGGDVTVDDIEIAMVLGGDGTILRAAELLRGTDCAIVGVNLGHVGFLAESEAHDVDITVDRVLARDYSVEERMTLDVKVLNNGEVIYETWALNEATVEKAERERMLELVIGVDGKPLSRFGADGVVLATPTGSTAYSFSAGGPVVWPGVQALLMVPLSAHALFNRPLVVAPESTLAVEITPNNIGVGVLWCDGRRQFDVPMGGSVVVTKSAHPVRLARLELVPFTDRLVNKFHLPVQGWRGQGSTSS
jgi:NAD+ kinase